jgi:hypothetical protein
MGHCCSMQVGDERLIWSVERLWELARDLPVESVPLKQFETRLANSSIHFWAKELPTGLEIADHFSHLLRVDLEYPIILTPDGTVMDGFHRLIKAWALGHETIRVVRFSGLPEPDERKPVESNRSEGTS